MKRLPKGYWSPKKLAKLAELMDTSMTNEEIAKEFGLRKKQIDNAISKHGLSNHEIGHERLRVSWEARKVKLKLQPPPKYMEPSPVTRVKTRTPAPKSRKLEFMDAVEEGTCLWMDGQLKCCGAPRRLRSRYCQHHHEKSLKKNEVKS